MEPELDSSQLAELSADLAVLQQSLTDLLVATELAAKPVKLKDNASRLSRMDEMHNQSILRANRNLTSNRLTLITRALERLHQGTYGLCSHCEEAIAFQRLKAYPEANKCLSCQSGIESA